VSALRGNLLFTSRLALRFPCPQVRNEIISSEETYVKELRTLVMVFLRPLEKWVEEGMNGLGIPAGMCCNSSVGGRSRLSACGVAGTAAAPVVETPAEVLRY